MSLIERDRLAAARKAPFSVGLLGKTIETDTVRSLGVDCETGNLLVNPQYIEDQAKDFPPGYIILHEELHVWLKHPQRGKGRDPYLWNIAADAAVEYILRGLFQWQPPEEYVTAERYGLKPGLSAEAYYKALSEMVSEAAKQGDNDDEQDGGKGGDSGESGNAGSQRRKDKEDGDNAQGSGEQQDGEQDQAGQQGGETGQQDGQDGQQDGKQDGQQGGGASGQDGQSQCQNQASAGRRKGPLGEYKTIGESEHGISDEAREKAGAQGSMPKSAYKGAIKRLADQFYTEELEAMKQAYEDSDPSRSAGLYCGPAKEVEVWASKGIAIADSLIPSMAPANGVEDLTYTRQRMVGYGLINYDVILPGMRDFGLVAVVVDTSASMEPDQLGFSIGVINGLIMAGYKVLLVHWDTTLRKTEIVESPINHTMLSGRGGTDMTSPIYWLKDEHPEIENVVIITDGYNGYNWPDTGYIRQDSRRVVVAIVPRGHAGMCPYPVVFSDGTKMKGLG